MDVDRSRSTPLDEIMKGDVEIHDLIARRRASGSVPGKRPDGAHLALVVEGGGMRGAYLAGMLLALQNAGARDVFDSIHGSSVGAHLATYFAARQAEVGRAIFLDEALSPRFMSLMHLISGHPFMDIVWMVDQVYLKTRKIAVDQLTGAAPELNIVATDIGSGDAVYFRGSDDTSELRAALIATAKLPIVAGLAFRYAGRTLLDGGLAAQVPIRSAQISGATHILVLSSRKRNIPKKSHRSIGHLIEQAALRVLFGHKVAEQYTRRRQELNLVRKQLLGLAPIELVASCVYVPDNAPTLKRLTRDRKLLEAGAYACERETVKLLRL